MRLPQETCRGSVDANWRNAGQLDANVSGNDGPLLQLVLPTMPRMSRLPRKSCISCGACPRADDASANSYGLIVLSSRGGP